MTIYGLIYVHYAFSFRVGDGYYPCSYTLHREYLCYISTHFSNLRHILHMFVGLSNLFIAVHSMTGYGVLVCAFQFPSRGVLLC